MSFDRDQLRMVLALTIVAVIAAGLLGLTDIATKEPIAKAQREALQKALTQVLPPFANDPQQQMLHIEGRDIYVAKDAADKPLAYAWEVVAPDGYAGSIRILVGILSDGRIHAIRVTDHRETPGLGDGIVLDAGWLGAFAGKRLESARWKVKKDGGDFDQFTGATITPRAVVHAVARALAFYSVQHSAMLAAVKGEEQ